jgi:Uncharacterized protein conserved in bacteria
MRIEEHDTLSKIDSAEWDRLVHDDVLASHAWLTTVECCTVGQDSFLYVVARDDEKLLGALACRVHSNSESTSLDKSFYGRAYGLARAAGFGATPGIVVGSRFGFSRPFLVDPSLSESQANDVADALIRRLVERAEVLNATVMFRNTRPGRFAGALANAGFVSSPELPTTYIDVRWPTFQSFIHDLRTVHRATVKGIRHQIGRAKREGIVIERVTASDQLSPEVYEILQSHQRRLNGAPLVFSERLLTESLQKLGDGVDLLLARDGPHLLGVMFSLRQGGVSHAILVGTSTEKARTTNTYFLLLNHVMVRAIECGDRRTYFGRLVYNVKLRRGCSIEHSLIWIRGRSKLHRAGLRRITPIRNIKVARMIRALEPVSRSNAAALQAH